MRDNKVMLNTKDLVFKKRLVRKLTKWYISFYIIKEVVLANVVKLRLKVFMRIYLVISVTKIIKYRELAKK